MIPLEDFFRKPDKVHLRLSPDGGRLAWMAPYKRRLNVFVRDLATGRERQVTSSETRDIAGFLWAGNDRLIYLQDTGGDENFRLYAVGVDGSGLLDLTPYDNVKCGIVDDLEDIDDQILFQMNRRDPELFDVFRLDVNSGEATLLAENPGNIQSWITDQDGRLRMATTTDGVNTSLLYRAAEEDEWRTVATYDFKEHAYPLYFQYDKDAIWVASNVGRDKTAIFEYDLESGKEGRLVYEHPNVDVSHLLLSKKRKLVTGVAFETDKMEYAFFDDQRAGLQATVDDQLPETVNTVVSTNRDETIYVVHSGSDRSRGAYYLFDSTTSDLTKLFDLSPWLDDTQMTEMQSVTYRSRDGLTIPGYLTLPKGDGPFPMVVHPHGGPWARDSWGFNPEVQFLANRGYAVLQMNFRGSTGYGRKFLEASFGQWGLAMQDDVSDGVNWAVEQGYAIKDKVAIYGGSYGGYATLAGMTLTPELYACGVSYVGVSNLFTWIAAFPPYWKPYLEMMYEMVGHPERDEERFKATSPFFHADSIKAPLLVAQGANDPRVKKEESDQIVAAMEKRGIPTEYIVKDDEGHGFQNEENVFEFYRAMEKFLGEHLA
ncbi:MAG: S9 family peptidase [Acidobacteria bacterium]|uniref:S9 family peptidase n=1 Tax=Candidatus Polarisedimenticola svalbardensis TaxID=2886004 RepID=A0A8J6XXR7_9BACT|nr:S9 family peptidase [Candidatus Polarisedimenticola svalbardensis]